MRNQRQALFLLISVKWFGTYKKISAILAICFDNGQKDHIADLEGIMKML
ncbi:MAG: hypothetical protein RSD35_05930 [Oscillospiraceae bacterium]